MTVFVGLWNADQHKRFHIFCLSNTCSLLRQITMATVFIWGITCVVLPHFVQEHHKTQQPFHQLCHFVFHMAFCQLKSGCLRLSITNPATAVLSMHWRKHSVCWPCWVWMKPMSNRFQWRCTMWYCNLLTAFLNTNPRFSRSSKTLEMQDHYVHTANVLLTLPFKKILHIWRLSQQLIQHHSKNKIK